MGKNKNTWLNVTITRRDNFKHWAQVRGIAIEENEDIVNIILTYTNGYDETFSIKRNELKSIDTQLEML